jgi:hypothetical protein
VDNSTDVVARSSTETAARLYAIAVAAAGFADQLDALRGQYPARGPLDADPVAAVLDQAAAAACDLHSSAASAADTIADRSAADDVPALTDRGSGHDGFR